MPHFFDQGKVALLYKYYLFGDLTWLALSQEQAQTKKRQEQIAWFLACQKAENSLVEQIEKKLKIGWNFARLSPLEKALLVYAVYQLNFTQNLSFPIFVNQVIEFSKRYLETNKHQYINKVLDLIYWT